MTKKEIQDQIKEAKRLDRALAGYVVSTRSRLGVSRAEALELMRDQADTVAKDLGMSVPFVTLWIAAELRRAKP